MCVCNYAIIDVIKCLLHATAILHATYLYTKSIYHEVLYELYENMDRRQNRVGNMV